MTDGVYGELTAMRTRTPFIDAFRKRQEQEGGQSAAVTAPVGEKAPIDTTPKRMSESFHKVVSITGYLCDALLLTGNIDPTSCA